MKIKIGDTVYTPSDDMIALYLTDKDKENISNMAPDAHVFVTYSADLVVSPSELIAFIEDPRLA